MILVTLLALSYMIFSKIIYKIMILHYDIIFEDIFSKITKNIMMYHISLNK